MNALPSSLLLLGIGGAGAAMTRSIMRGYGHGIRSLVLDSDAASGGNGDIPFMLLGGNRLAGRGTGGQTASARAAFQDNTSVLDTALEGVRTVVIVTALGGGTGGGATSEVLKRLHTLGIVTLVFATTPFTFEGASQLNSARAAMGPISQNADVSVFLPLDKLVAGDTMKDAFRQGIETLSTGVTLLWRLLEKPGYISLDAERLRNILLGCGKALFATASAEGENRDRKILESFAENPLLVRSDSAPKVRTILIGVLGGDDLRLSEIASISSGVSVAFGMDAAIELGTVNDESAFAGKLTVVLLVFEENAMRHNQPVIGGVGHSNRASGERALMASSRFRNAEKTMWHDEDLDIATYLRRSLTLDR